MTRNSTNQNKLIVSVLLVIGDGTITTNLCRRTDEMGLNFFLSSVRYYRPWLEKAAVPGSR